MIADALSSTFFAEVTLPTVIADALSATFFAEVTMLTVIAEAVSAAFFAPGTPLIVLADALSATFFAQVTMLIVLADALSAAFFAPGTPLIMLALRRSELLLVDLLVRIPERERQTNTARSTGCPLRCCCRRATQRCLHSPLGQKGGGRTEAYRAYIVFEINRISRLR